MVVWSDSAALRAMGCRVTVVPATATAEAILRHEPDGVFLSNGPGDPASNYTTWTWTNSGNNCTQAYPTTFYVKITALASTGTCMDFSIVAFVQ